MAKINLLPWRENLRQQRQQMFLVFLGATAAAAVLLVFLANYAMNSMITGQENRNDYLRAEIRKLENDIRRIEDLEQVRDNLVARKEVIERLQANRSMTVHLFNQLARTVPEGVTLDSVRQASSEVTVEGTSESETRVSEFMRAMESAEWLHEPRLRIVEQNRRQDRPGQPYRFELKVRIASPGSQEEEI